MPRRPMLLRQHSSVALSDNVCSAANGQQGSGAETHQSPIPRLCRGGLVKNWLNWLNLWFGKSVSTSNDVCIDSFLRSPLGMCFSPPVQEGKSSWSIFLQAGLPHNLRPFPLGSGRGFSRYNAHYVVSPNG
ncbi:hypothetical protein CEXT_696341 [Caerostris extrusa]|uniref:Uncharacterized protein n=1 Tax=Caerostris extrusa TaxID=172846 RepID=A0AAV4YBU5_CAEEX|nr:hypothetical protein CEXT_696341 [Caerostris extrusa]